MADDADADADRTDITLLLQEWQDGRVEALERLMPLVYNELETTVRFAG